MFVDSSARAQKRLPTMVYFGRTMSNVNEQADVEEELDTLFRPLAIRFRRFTQEAQISFLKP